jgi:hypothetical protein
MADGESDPNMGIDSMTACTSVMLLLSVPRLERLVVISTVIISALTHECERACSVAPCSMSSRTHATCPPRAARCSAVT